MYDTPSYNTIKTEEDLKQGVRTFFKLLLIEVGMSRPFKPEYLVVMKISLRARPLSRMAIPASASFWYD